MGCQCQKPEFLNDELTSDEKNQIKNIEADNNYLSNNNYNFKSNKYIDPNGRPLDKFSKYIFDQINSIREDPQSFINIIQNAKKNIKLGICGEHGGDPSSVEFFHNIGLNYVSCSPFRVPIARLAAAQAAIKAKKN